MPGLCKCAAAIKREGLVMQDGLLKLQRSGLRLRTLQEVLAHALSFYRVHLLIVPSPLLVLCSFWFCALISLCALYEICASENLLQFAAHMCHVISLLMCLMFEVSA